MNIILNFATPYAAFHEIWRTFYLADKESRLYAGCIQVVRRLCIPSRQRVQSPLRAGARPILDTDALLFQ
jgi:hypothetical protein